MFRIALAAALVFALTACAGGGPTGGGGSVAGQPSPEELWITAVKQAGFLALDGDYGSMFTRSRLLCDMDNGDRALILSLTLDDSASGRNMTKLGIRKSDAVRAYIDATEEYSCPMKAG